MNHIFTIVILGVDRLRIWNLFSAASNGNPILFPIFPRFPIENDNGGPVGNHFFFGVREAYREQIKIKYVQKCQNLQKIWKNPISFLKRKCLNSLGKTIFFTRKDINRLGEARFCWFCMQILTFKGVYSQSQCDLHLSGQKKKIWFFRFRRISFFRPIFF